MSDYLMGCDILGFDEMTPEEMKNAPPGWLAPAQLAVVDRALTPAEQKLVDAYQIKQAKAVQAAEEKKGGPKATATITRKGATVAVVPKPKKADPFADLNDLESATMIEAPLSNAPWAPPQGDAALRQKIIIGVALGLIAVGLGGSLLLAIKAKWLGATLGFLTTSAVAATALALTDPSTET